MRIVPVVIDSHLRVDGNLLGNVVVNQILDELTIENTARVDAKRVERYGWWELAEDFLMAELDGDQLVMTRGYAYQLKLLLRERGIKIRWIDKRKFRRGAPIGKEEFSYRPHQPAAVRAIRRHQQLIYKAPTGSGKTVTILGAIWEMSPMYSLVLVDRINLVDQWLERAVEHVGIREEEIGVIGDGKWSEGRITIATVQTLIRKIDELRESGWFRKHSFVALDECHHVTAETFMTIMQEFHARVRMGTSATPDKTGVFAMALNTLGEVAYETTQEELRELGILVEPRVEVVPTRFEFDYWGDHKANKRGYCNVTECKNRTPYHRHRNNYHGLKSALITDKDRNDLVLGKIVDDYKKNHVQLVITDQTKHIEAFLEEWNATHGSFIDYEPVVLTGKQSRKQRVEIISYIEDEDLPHIIFSTIAGEALDIGKLDRIHLPWPTRNPRKTEQNVGRGTRMYEGREDVVVYDYVDNRVDVLVGQFRSRRWKCYEPLGFEIIEPEDQQFAPKRKKGLTSLGAAR